MDYNMEIMKELLILLAGLLVVNNAQNYQGNVSKATPPVGDMYGRREYYNGVMVLQFLSIPYAESLTRESVLSRPLLKTDIKGGDEETIYYATVHLRSCPQSPPWYGYGNVPVRNQSINCLHLDVYAPRTLDPITPRAVMVFIHGGEFLYEQGMRYDGSLLAVHGDVVVVTMNYRLDAYGFLSTKDSLIPGNLGLRDQRLAMKWVKDNIAAFGGDSNRITVFGSGAGANSIGMHLLFENNTGLFQRAILQSGVALSPLGLAYNPLDFAHKFAVALDCADLNATDFSHRLKDCVVSKSSSEVLETTLKAKQFDTLTYRRVLGPVVDGDLLEDTPLRLITRPDIPFRKVDLMVGTNSAEGGQVLHQLGFYQDTRNFNLDKGVPREVFKDLFARSILRDYFNGSKDVEQELLNIYSGSRISESEQARKLVALYGDLMQHAPSVKTLRKHAEFAPGKKTFQYYFAHNPETTNTKPWFQGANHKDELAFVFGPEVIYPQGTSVSDEEIQFSRRIMKYWSNFAKTGNPNYVSEDIWKEFTTQYENYMYLAFTPRLRRNLRSTSLKYLIELTEEKEDYSGAISHSVSIILSFVFFHFFF